MSVFDKLVNTMDAELISVFGDGVIVKTGGTAYLINAVLDIDIERLSIDGFAVRRSELTFKTNELPTLKRGDTVETDKGLFKINEIERVDEHMSRAVIVVL